MEIIDGRQGQLVEVLEPFDDRFAFLRFGLASRRPKVRRGRKQNLQRRNIGIPRRTAIFTAHPYAA